MQAHKPDYIFIILIGAWLVFGLLMLFSASSPSAYTSFHDAYFYIKRQLLFGVLPGLILFYLLSRLDFRLLKRWALPLLIFATILLVLVLIPGVGGGFGAANSWLSFLGFSFQPAELAKLALILFLASWLDDLSEAELHNWRQALSPFVLVMIVLGGLILKQPDLGTLIVIFMIAISMYFVSGVSLAYIAGLLAVSLAGFLSLIVFSSYRLKRLLTFLNTGNDALGAGYQINQALLAIGSGGWWGLGWGHSRQKFQYLPEVSADSIFPIIAEELGFLVCAVFVIFIGLTLWRGLRLANLAPNRFGKLFCVGIVVWLAGQSFINIGTMTGLLPLTGLPLPLISHGGTAMVTLLAGLGIMVNISRQTKPV